MHESSLSLSKYLSSDSTIFSYQNFFNKLLTRQKKKPRNLLMGILFTRSHFSLPRTRTYIQTHTHTHIYIYIYIYIYHVVPSAGISLTLSRHFPLSFIASGRSSGLHPVSSHTCWMYVRAGRLAFARPYVGVHRSTSHMSSSLLLQQCLVRLTWIVVVMGGRWPYS